MPMNLILRLPVFGLLLFSFGGCIEHELPIPIKPAGSLVTHEVSIGPSYDTRVYYSLQNSKVIASHSPLDWCLKLSPLPESGKIAILLNSSRTMRIARDAASGSDQGLTDDEVQALGWRIDPPSGWSTDSAEAQFEVGESFFVDLGYGAENELLGKRRITLQSISEVGFDIRIELPNLEQSESVIVPLSPSESFVYLSILHTNSPEIEPPSDQWELLLTSYTELLEGTIPYQVTGILTPSERVEIIEPVNTGWEEFSQMDWSNFPKLTDWNAIGYDWKSFDLDAGFYSIDANNLYGVVTSEGREFQLRILDFYDSNGDKGHFTFEAFER